MTKIFDTTRQVFNIDKRTLNIDVEKTPTRGWAYQSYEARVFEIEEDWHIQSVAWTWGDSDKIECVALPDFKLYKKEPHNDRELVEYIYNEHKKALLVVGHNIDRFDIPMLRHRYMIHGLPPLPKIPTKDTYKMAKKFGFFQKSLNGLAREMGFELKEAIGAGELWKRCYDGDMEAWRLYKKYNKKDVYIDRLIYRRLISWEPNLPQLTPLDKCQICNSPPDRWKRNGMKYGRGWEQQRYACLDCGFANLYGPKYKL